MTSRATKAEERTGRVRITKRGGRKGRGFHQYGQAFADTYGSFVDVYESSSAEGPHVWLKVVDRRTQMGGHAHLTPTQARKVIARLQAWLDEIPSPLGPMTPPAAHGEPCKECERARRQGFACCDGCAGAAIKGGDATCTPPNVPMTACYALYLETSAREVARLERVNADLLAKLNTSWQASDIYAEEGEEARRERDALKAENERLRALLRQSLILPRPWVVNGGVTWERWIEAAEAIINTIDRAALATPAEPPAAKPGFCVCGHAIVGHREGTEATNMETGEGFSYEGCQAEDCDCPFVPAPATEPTEGGGE